MQMRSDGAKNTKAILAPRLTELGLIKTGVI
jgi:hypothetical protein